MGRVDVGKLIRPHLVEIQTYDPVDPPELLAEQAEVQPDEIIKLNGNENPYGASPRAIEALANLPVHMYPDPRQRKMRAALSGYTGMDHERIIVGAGSDELIDLLFRLFISPGDKILDCDPTFGMYGFCARIAGGKIAMVPRDEAFDVDVEAVKGAVDSQTKVIFVSSPNNPTGNLASETQVRALLDTGLVVVIDEAYYEFCGQTVAPLVNEHENLVVLRTMSKWAGLAGLRVGYGIMSPQLIGHIFHIKPPYSVSIAAEVALLASLEDAPALLENVGRIVDERERMASLLTDIPGVTPWPSNGNFVLCQFPPGRAQEVYDRLAHRGIFVRNFRSERLSDCFRVAVGTPEQTDKLVAAIGEFL